MKNHFALVKSIDGVIGAIDGTHIPIIGQESHNKIHINRKYYKLFVIIRCDSLIVIQVGQDIFMLLGFSVTLTCYRELLLILLPWCRKEHS